VQRLRQNLFFKLLSLACSFGLFLYVRKAESTDSPENLVPLVFRTDPGVEVVEPMDPRFVHVTLRGPADLVRGIKPADITAHVDLTGKRKSTSPDVVPVQIELPSHLRDRVDPIYNPHQVKVRLDERITRYMQVVPRIDAQLPSGTAVGTTLVHPDQVSITGLSLDVNRVKAVRAIVTEITGTAVVDARTRVSAVDEAGNELRDRLEIQPQIVRVRAPLERKVWTKSGVYVNPQLSSPPLGTLVTSVIVRPNRVEVTGSDDALASLWVLSTESIDLTALSGRVDRIVKLIAPEGVTRVDPQRVRVTVELERTATPGPAARRPGSDVEAAPGVAEKRATP
jgi:YbbR domain-containing protein